MHYNQYNNIPMGIGAVLARNPEARRNFALASQEEQTALIDSCTHCNSYEEMLARIQALEEKVAALSGEDKKEAGDGEKQCLPGYNECIIK